MSNRGGEGKEGLSYSPQQRPPPPPPRMLTGSTVIWSAGRWEDVSMIPCSHFEGLRGGRRTGC